MYLSIHLHFIIPYYHMLTTKCPDKVIKHGHNHKVSVQANLRRFFCKIPDSSGATKSALSLWLEYKSKVIFLIDCNVVKGLQVVLKGATCLKTALLTINNNFMADLQVHPDMFMRREVKSFVVHCTLMDNGCSWKGAVRELAVSTLPNMRYKINLMQ